MDGKNFAEDFEHRIRKRKIKKSKSKESLELPEMAEKEILTKFLFMV